MQHSVKILCLVLVFAAQPLPSAEPPKLVDIGLRRQLLVDDFAIAERRGITREQGVVTKANGGKPIFDARFYGTVLHDEGRFKLWFRKPEQQGYGYAESLDGLKFEKKAALTGINFAGDVNLAVEVDRNASDPSRRFLGGYDAPGMAAGIAVSPDGIRWTPLNDGKPVTFRAADCHNQFLWDPMAKLYRLFTRTDYGSGGGPLANTAAPNFEVRGTRGMFNSGSIGNPDDWKIKRQWWLNREGPKEYLRRQVYSMTVWIHEGIYFALMSVYEYPGDLSEGLKSDHVKRHERDVMNFYLATSRDCDSWDLTWVYAGKPIVPRGPDGSFDKAVVFPSSTVVTHDDRHWFYYSGNNERHGTAERKPPVWFEKDRAIGVATLPRDRFVALAAGKKTGTIVTKPFRLEGSQVELNLDALQGECRVEVLDENGRPIPGFAGEDSIAIRGADSLKVSPGWKKHRNLKSLKGGVIQLRVRLTNAKLFAFQIRD